MLTDRPVKPSETTAYYGYHIRTNVSVRDVCSMYGIEVNRAGFTRCFIHGEKTASLKVYDGDRGWYCFGCHRGGDVISFVMFYFGIDFIDAVRKINQDFGLGLPIDKPLQPDAEKEAKRIAYQRRVAQDKRKKLLERLRAERDKALERYVAMDGLSDAARSDGLQAAQTLSDIETMSYFLDSLPNSMATALKELDGAWYDLCEAESRLRTAEMYNGTAL